MQLVIRDLSKTYPNGTQALKDISLDVPQGMFGRKGDDNVADVEAAGADPVGTGR